MRSVLVAVLAFAGAYLVWMTIVWIKRTRKDKNKD